jgi:hypothetical protein
VRYSKSEVAMDMISLELETNTAASGKVVSQEILNQE